MLGGVCSFVNPYLQPQKVKVLRRMPTVVLKVHLQAPAVFALAPSCLEDQYILRSSYTSHNLAEEQMHGSIS